MVQRTVLLDRETAGRVAVAAPYGQGLDLSVVGSPLDGLAMPLRPVAPAQAIRSTNVELRE